MVAGVDGDATREAVLRATAAFAREVGARVVAEGVERPEELAALRAMDIDYGQGWLFGKPGPAWPEDAPCGRAAPCAGGVGRAGSSATSRGRDDARAASEVVADHLARRGLLPAVLLESGGRLRCQATRGLLAGLRRAAARRPASSAARSAPASTAVVEDVGEAPDYMPAIPGRPGRGVRAAAGRRRRSSACSTPRR